MARANTKGTQITFAVFRSYTGQLRSVDCDANIMPGFANTGNTVTMEEGLVDMSMEGEEAELTFPPSPPMSPQPQGINIALASMAFSTSEEHLTQEERDLAKEVAKQLIQLGDEMESTLTQHCDSVWLELSRALSRHDQSLQQHFKEGFQRLRARITTKTIVKVFYLGFRILSCAGTTPDQLPEQTQMVENVMEFLIEQVTSWIQEQGGWEQWPQVLQSPEPEQEEDNPPVFCTHSTPTLLQHNLRAASTPPPQQRGTTAIIRGWRSQSFSYSRAIPIPSITESYSGTSGSYPRRGVHTNDDESSSSRRSSVSSSLILVSAAGALTVALASYLQS